MPARKKTSIQRELPPFSHPPCASQPCAAPGEYKAPLSRDNIHEYQWLCLDHVREYNRKWDYFAGMGADEIESFRHDAVTGHRPTWLREDVGGRNKANYQRALEEELQRFLGGQKQKPAAPRLPAKERKALAELELSAHCAGAAALKKHYRSLVKRYHPDLHAGDTAIEERFKRINAAYAYLLALYEKA